ncbi:MAG TPA: methionine biosynthesis protein MetW [bacterium]|nr:methionine biosynthesis protein MetW [bacterium]
MRLDHQIIYDLIAPGSRVLDLGCGDGALLAALQQGKRVKGQGVELDESCIYLCVEKGVSVFHGDIGSGLSGYPDRSFDYVILNQSLQEVRNVRLLLEESLRVGNRVIVGFPNFAHYTARFTLMFRGHTPVTPSLPYDWSDTPNVRFMSISDFNQLCRRAGFRILSRHDLGARRPVRFLPNLFALTSLFVLTRPE